MWKSSLNHGSHLCWTFPWYFVSKGPKNSLKWCVGGKNTKNSARIYTTQLKVFVRKIACQVSIVRTNVKHAPPKYFWRHPNSQEIQWKLWVSRWCNRYTFDYLYSCNLPKYFQIWKILKLKYGFHKKYFQKNEPLTSWTLFPRFFPDQCWLVENLFFTKKSITRFVNSVISTNQHWSGKKRGKKVFNSSEFHFCGSISYEIHILASKSNHRECPQ